MDRGLIGVLRGCNKNTQGFVFSIMESQSYSIGKDDTSDFRIDIEDFICDNHCMIASSAPGLPNNIAPNVYLTDTSTTGTYLNGCLIGYRNTVLLYSGCVISFVSKHINFQYIQYSPEDEHFSAFTVELQTILPNSVDSPVQRLNTTSKKIIRTTNTEIGFGNQSRVLLAYDVETPNRQLACKYTNMKRVRFEPWVGVAYEEEVKILKSNKHPNVLSLVACHEDHQHKFVFLPMYYGGSLQERLNDGDPSRNRMGERDAIFLIRQLFAGLNYLHGRDIIHCDIKPTNLLLADRYVNRPRLVIADFGHSMEKANKPETWPDDWGTLAYRSPEMVKLQEFSEKVDCWAAGIIFYQLLVGELPFLGFEKEDLEEAIVNQQIDLAPLTGEISPSSREIIAQLTLKDQYQRASIKQVMPRLLCTWFNGADKTAYDHYLKERHWWFDEEMPPVKQNTNPINCDRQPDNVETIKTFRDCSRQDTFLTAAQTDILSYPSLAQRLDSFRFIRNFL